MITNEKYFFKNQSSVSTSGPLYNVNDGTLILQVDGNVSNLELLVLGNTDLIDNNFVTLKTINASDYNMSDKITSTGIYWIDINGIRKIKLNLNKITGSVSVKAITKRGLTTDLVARAMAANSASGGITLDDVEAITGELANLNTEDKSNLVNAINEVANLDFSMYSVYYAKPKDGEDYILINDLPAYKYPSDVAQSKKINILPTGLDLKVRTADGNISNITGVGDINNKKNGFRAVIIGYSGDSMEEMTSRNAVISMITYEADSPQFYLGYLYKNNTSISSPGSAFPAGKIMTYNEVAYEYASKDNVLTKTNTTSYTPTSDYNPATKKYVDDSINALPSSAGSTPIYNFAYDESDFYCSYNNINYVESTNEKNVNRASEIINDMYTNGFGTAIINFYNKNSVNAFSYVCTMQSGSIHNKSTTFTFMAFNKKEHLYTQTYDFDNFRLDIDGTWTDDVFTADKITCQGIAIAFSGGIASVDYVDDQFTTVNNRTLYLEGTGLIFGSGLNTAENKQLLTDTINKNIGSYFNVIVRDSDSVLTWTYSFDTLPQTTSSHIRALAPYYSLTVARTIVYIGDMQINYTYDADKGLYNITQWTMAERRQLSITDQNEYISGTKTFTTLPKTTLVPTTDDQFVNKKYVDDQVGNINTILATLTTVSEVSK